MEPPHGRGKVACTDQTIQPDGITPAQAGKSPACRVHPCTGRDHPRVGGEKMLARVHTSTSRGSPSHRRGKVFLTDLVRVVVGITPAQAGKSQGDRADRGAEQDHPRTGGEKKCDQQQSRAGQGSPPHRRGKECVDAASEVDRGITPAQAGKRSGRFPAGPRRWDHPRMGGEKRPAFSMMDSVSGSPPRGRGKVFKHRDALGEIGITPAWAGKSPASQPWSPPLWMMVIRPRP